LLSGHPNAIMVTSNPAKEECAIARLRAVKKVVEKTQLRCLGNRARLPFPTTAATAVT